MTGALEAGAKFSPAGIRALVSSKANRCRVGASRCVRYRDPALIPGARRSGSEALHSAVRRGLSAAYLSYPAGTLRSDGRHGDVDRLRSDRVIVHLAATRSPRPQRNSRSQTSPAALTALRLLHSLAPDESILARAEPRPLPGGRVSFATCTSRQAEARRVGAESVGQRVMKPSSANPAIDPIPHHSMIRAESLRHDKVWSREALQCPPIVPKLSGL
jgi:hypothetical protein